MSLVVHQAKLGFISGRSGGISHLRAHLSYVSREQALYFAYNATAQTFNKLFNFAHEKLKRRKDARIALRMHIALPYLWYVISKKHPDYLELKAKELARFIANALQLNESELMIFFHKPEENSRNFHAHIVAIPQTRDGKALDISPAMLKAFHQKLDEFLAEQGFEVFRYRDFPELQLSRSQIRALSLPAGVYKREEIATVVAEKRRAVRMYAEGELNKRNKQVYDFCNMLYSKDDVIWLMLRNSRTGEVEHRRKRVAEINDRFLAWLRHKNAQGFDVYITLNNFRADSQRRTEQEIEPKQDKIWLDLDSEKLKRDGLEVLKQIMNELKLPPPTTLVRTSETSYGRNYQAVWKFDQKVDFSRLKRVMQELEKRYGLDATHDGARVFRVPGYNNKKQGKVGRDLCSLVAVGKVYSISLLEKLELELARDTHAERTLSVLRKKEEKEEVKFQPQPSLKPELRPKPKLQPQAKPQQDQKKKLDYMSALLQEASKLIGRNINISATVESEWDAEFWLARKLLRFLTVHEVEKLLREILAKLRPDRESYAKEVVLSAYQEALIDVGFSLGINMLLDVSQKSYSELEWAFAKELARASLERFKTTEKAFEKALKVFEMVVQDFRPEKLAKSKGYAELTMRKAFEEVLREKQEREQERDSELWRGPPGLGL